MVSIGPPTLVIKLERPPGPGHGQPLYGYMGVHNTVHEPFYLCKKWERRLFWRLATRKMKV